MVAGDVCVHCVMRMCHFVSQRAAPRSSSLASRAARCYKCVSTVPPRHFSATHHHMFCDPPRARRTVNRTRSLPILSRCPRQNRTAQLQIGFHMRRCDSLYFCPFSMADSVIIVDLGLPWARTGRMLNEQTADRHHIAPRRFRAPNGEEARQRAR